MPFTRAGQLARSVIAARATDSIGLVAENLRMSQGGVIPVLDRSTLGEIDPGERNARVIGLISQSDLSRATRNLMAPVAQPIAQPVAVYAGGEPADVAHQNGNGLANGHAISHGDANGVGPGRTGTPTAWLLSRCIIPNSRRAILCAAMCLIFRRIFRCTTRF